MLEVHPPHHAASTWRDFLIHMATIVLGLLIAIGLEQAVEALHRNHERRALEQDMRAESERNLPILRQDLDQGLASEAWWHHILDALRDGVSAGGFVTATLPARPAMVMTIAPSRAVWTVARANGKVALLREETAEIYSRLDYEAEQYDRAQYDRMKNHADALAVGERMGVKLVPGGTVRLTIADRDELARAASHAWTAWHNANYWQSAWAGASDAVAQQVQSRAAMDPYLDRHGAELPRLTDPPPSQASPAAATPTPPPVLPPEAH
jgi:hypothetical protein